MMRSMITFIIIVISGSMAQAAILTGPVINPANGHSYYLLEQDTWTNSEAFAQTLGGHLVTINDAAENDWVFDTFGTFGGVDRNLWVGLNDAADEGTFVWASDEPFAYSSWSEDEPNNGDSGEAEHYVSIWKPVTLAIGRNPGQWNDFPNDPAVTFLDRNDPDLSQPLGVVEVVPEPSTALLALGGLMLMGCRRRER